MQAAPHSGKVDQACRGLDNATAVTPPRELIRAARGVMAVSLVLGDSGPLVASG